jgi:hypothetical protein
VAGEKREKIVSRSEFCVLGSSQCYMAAAEEKKGEGANGKSETPAVE